MAPSFIVLLLAMHAHAASKLLYSGGDLEHITARPSEAIPLMEYQMGVEVGSTAPLNTWIRNVDAYYCR